MASSNAGPITGGELIRAVQDGQTVYLTRPQVASLLAFTALTSPRASSFLTEKTGDENFRAVQGTARIEMNAADMLTYLAGTATPQEVPRDRQPSVFTGREKLVVRQGAMQVPIDLSQVLYVRGLGGSLGGVTDPGGGTPTPTPILANLASVATSMLSTNSNRTWWSDETATDPTMTWALDGTTDNTGLQYLSKTRVSDRATVDMRRIESPRFFTPDEHQSVSVAWLPNGGFVFAVVGHSNAVTATAANQGRVLIGYCPDADLSNIRELQVYTCPSTTTSLGVNYGYWEIQDQNNWLFFTMNDALQGEKPLRFTNGDYKSGVWCRMTWRNAVVSGGENQGYGKLAQIDATTVRHYCQPHPSNTRNVIRYLTRNPQTGEVFAGSTSLGNLYEGTATMYNYSSDSGATVAFDPGAGNSCRLMDAVGTGLGGAKFASDGSGAFHFWYENGVEVNLGTCGSELENTPQRRYFPGLVRAREPHSGWRFYRCYNDGAGNSFIERLDMASLGGAITRTQIDSAVAPVKILRPYAYKRATSTLAMSYTKGTYSSYTTFSVGITLSDGGGTGAVSAPSNLSAPVISGTPQVGQTLTTTNGTWNGNPVPTYAYQWKSGTDNVGTNQNTYVPGTGDIGKTITCTVTATNSQGSASATSAATSAVIAAASGGTLFLEDNFTESSSTPITSHTSDSGATWGQITGQQTVSASGKVVSANTGNSVAQSSAVMPTQDGDIEFLLSVPSEVANAVGAGLRCTAGAYEGYYFMVNDASNLAQIVRVVAGSATVLATAPYTPADGGLLRGRVRTNGTGADLSYLLNGSPLTLSTGGQSVNDPTALTGTRVHIRNNSAATTASAGAAIDRLRAYSV